MIQFTNTSANPKTVMIKLPYTSLTFTAVLRSVRLFNAAIFAKPFLRQFNFSYILNRLYYFFFLLHFNFNTCLQLHYLIFFSSLCLLFRRSGAFKVNSGVLDISKLVILPVDEQFGFFASGLGRLGFINEAWVSAGCQEEKD